jgi:hypothetical protein
MAEAFVSVSAVAVVSPKPFPFLPTFRSFPLLVPSRKQRRRLALSLPFYCSRDPPVAASANFTKMGRRKPPPTKEKVLSDWRRSGDDDRPVCPGCGVFMQDSDPNLPNFYKKKVIVYVEEEEEFEVGERDGFSSKSDFKVEMLVANDDSSETGAFEEDESGISIGSKIER